MAQLAQATRYERKTEIAKMRDSLEIDGQNARARIQLMPERLAAFLPRDGILTFLLTFVIIYITVVSIQSVRPVWADGLQILTTAMLFGVGIGYLAMQQNFIRGNMMHLLALLIGSVTSFFLTASAVLNGNRIQLLENISIWLRRSLIDQQVSTDNSVFVLFLTLLTFLLAYLTIWLVFIARRPWLALVANSVVLLININQSTADQYYFLIVFLIVTLLLLVRFALAENVRQWRNIGLRFSPDLGWDFMQAGAIFAVIVALLPNLLPFAQPNQTLLNYLTSDQSPITQAQQRFENLFSGANGRGSGSYSFFDNNLQLVGSVYLPDTPILRYTLPISSQSDGSQYLITEAFSTYDGIGNWQRDQAIEQSYAANQTQPASTNVYQLDTYRITFLATPGGGQHYIFAPGSGAAAFNIPSASLISVNSREPITWLAQSPLPVGSSYIATGYVSGATASQLQSVQYPAAVPSNASSPYPSEILTEYLPQDERIDPYIISTAKNVTRGATNMYAAAADIEAYLHNPQNFTYNSHNPNPPANEDATVWFLQRKQGFCTFFASAMALMGRALGMPTRIVSGYASGAYDARTNSFIVRGTQAHTWTQIYFGQYGWINFEPTASFSPFARPLANGPSANPQGPSQTPATTPGAAQRGRTQNTDPIFTGGAGNGASGIVAVTLNLGLLALIALLIAGAVALWWRSLYKSYTPVARGFARLILLGSWAGVTPKRSQTPREYASQLAAAAPVQREAIERVGALYSRERWGHPLTPTETATTEKLYEQGRSALLTAIASRAKQSPARLLRLISRRSRSR